MRVAGIGAAFLFGASSALASPIQPLVAPRSNFDAVINATFALCPAVVKGTEAFPDATVALALGFKAARAQSDGERWFDGIDRRGRSQVRVSNDMKICTVRFAGPGYDVLANAVLDTIQQQQPPFSRILTDTDKSMAGEVYDRYRSDGVTIERFLIAKQAKTQTLSVRYQLQAKR